MGRLIKTALYRPFWEWVTRRTPKEPEPEEDFYTPDRAWKEAMRGEPQAEQEEDSEG